MRGVVKLILIVAILAIGLPGQAAAHAGHDHTGGLTLTPATLTLRLAPGELQRSADFTIANHYDSPVTLDFVVEPVVASLALSKENVTLAPQETLRQTITLRDNSQLSPGSQAVNLVISQTATTGSSVGVLPSIRMPVILVKEDGAVERIALAGLDNPFFRITMPASLAATIHNSGNMIAIPRGFITITGPTGTAVRQGALNTASQAVSPGDNITLATAPHQLEKAYWPGVYRTSLSYGLGGGQPAAVASDWFVYVAWWHLVVLAAVVFCIYYGVRRIRRQYRKKPLRSHHPPRKTLLRRRRA